MSEFIKDTILIGEKLNVQLREVEQTSLRAVILPYYIDPDTMDLVVVLKRSIMSGGYLRNGRKMGITAITIDLPEDKPITIEEAYASLNLGAKFQSAIPFGSVMISPENSTETYELVLVQTEPFTFLDKQRGIIKQEKGKYEIGAVKFSEIVEGIQNQIVNDIKTRLILNELYILAIEEGNKSANNNNGNHNTGIIGGGENLPPGFGGDNYDTVKTSPIPDDVIAKNSQMDFGAMYAKASTSGDFKTIERPE